MMGDACPGDSGGPLVLREDGKNTVIGVMSQAGGGCTLQHPRLYANVAYYLDWIKSEISDGWCQNDSGTTTTVVTSAPTTEVPTTIEVPSTTDVAITTAKGLPQECKQENVYYQGTLKQIGRWTTASNARRCELKCKRNRSCVGWTYYPKNRDKKYNKLCQTFTKVDQVKPIEDLQNEQLLGTISGSPKMCSPSTTKPVSATT